MNCIFSNSDCNGNLKYRMPLAAIEKSAAMCEYHWTLRQHDVRVAASTGCTCWEGYERVPGTKPCKPGSCRKKSSIENSSKTVKDELKDTEFDEGGFIESQAIDTGKHGDNRGIEGTSGIDEPIPSDTAAISRDGFSKIEPSFEGVKYDNPQERSPKSPVTHVRDYVEDASNRGELRPAPAPLSVMDDVLDAEGQTDPRQQSRGQRGVEDPSYVIEMLDPLKRAASKESSDDSFVPPESVASNAKRGLELRREHHRGGTEIGVARARDLSNRKGLSYSTIKRMKAYFDRHEVDKKGEGWGKDSAGYIAWLLWGGDSGRSWANKIVKQHEKESSVKESYMELCAACGNLSCLGHEKDSVDHMVLIAHASEDHSSCHPDACSSVGRSFHAHICSNCGGDTPCNGVRTASTCDTFDGFCKTCFVELAGIKVALESEELNKHMRNRNTGHPPVTQDEVDRAMGAGHSLQTARGEVGPHRPSKEEKAAATEEPLKRGILRKGPNGEPDELSVRMQEWADKKLEQYDGKHEGEPSKALKVLKWFELMGASNEASVIASNECGTCGHGWANHGKKTSCSCCADFDTRKASTDLPDWLKEAQIRIAEDAQVIDLDSYRRRSLGVPPFHPSMLPPKGSPFHPPMEPPKKPKIYDQHEELTFKPGDEPQTHVDIQTGEVTRWHPGLQTPRGGDE